MSLTWDAPRRWNVSIQIAAPSCHINYLCLCQKFVTLGSHIFWLFSALLFHVVDNLPCQSKVFFLLCWTPVLQELYKISVFYVTVCPSVCHLDIFLRNCSLVFSSESLFKKSSYFNGYSTFLKTYKILRVISTTALLIPVYVQSAYRK